MAQLIANSQNADKVVFLMDRIELGTQSPKVNIRVDRLLRKFILSGGFEVEG